MTKTEKAQAFHIIKTEHNRRKIITSPHRNRAEHDKISSKAIHYGETNLHKTDQSETDQILLYQYLFSAGENWREALG